MKKFIYIAISTFLTFNFANAEEKKNVLSLRDFPKNICYVKLIK